jgi:predicted nucleic acid-binding protein
MVFSQNLNKLIYLDNCALCRPFDNQDFLRIRMETTAVDLIIANVRSGIFTLLYSPVHLVEISNSTDDLIRNEVEGILTIFGKPIAPLVNTHDVHYRTRELITFKFGVADAAHLAFAETSAAEFVSCDDELLKKYRRLKTHMWCGTPIEFCEKEGLK